MHLPQPWQLGAFYGLTEVLLSITRRAVPTDRRRDRNSLPLIWLVIVSAVSAAILFANHHRVGGLPHREIFYIIGLTLFAVGLVIRWYSIFWLGRFFTVDVAIAHAHKVIDSGPYRFIRHPSYAGAILALIGIGFCFGNWLSLVSLTLPVVPAFRWRIHVEEAALLDALGPQYADYMARTKRLVPLVY